LMWRLVSHVSGQRRSEEAAAEAALVAATNSAAPNTAALSRAQSLLKLSWIVCLVGVVGIIGWVGLKLSHQSVGLPGLTPLNLLRAVLVVVVVGLAGGSCYFKAMRAFEWQVLLRLHQLRLASDEYVIATQEKQRWAMMYAGMVDWGRVLGPLLHHPWAEEMADSARGSALVSGLPASVAVARPTDIEMRLAPIDVIRGIEAVCRRGWVEKEFDGYVRLSALNNQLTGSRTGDLPADLDLGLRSHGPRADLVRTAISDATREDAAQRLATDIRTLISNGSLKLPDQAVTRLGPYSSGDSVEDKEFFTASMHIRAPLIADLFTASAEVAGRNLPERTLYCLPPGMAVSTAFDGAEVLEGGDAISTRVDISRSLQSGDVRIFASEDAVRDVHVGAVDDYN
jgi:hypothetical protein